MDRKAQITRRAEDLTGQGAFAGIEWRILKDGQLWHDGKVGMSDPIAGIPLADVPIYRIYSMTKPIVSAVGVMLLEEGLFRLGDRVGDYLPEFAKPKVIGSDGTGRAAGTDMLIEHLFTHRSGLSYGFLADCPVGPLYREGLFDGTAGLAGFSQRLARYPLAFDPGTTYRYSHATDILGRLLEVVSGQRLDALLKARVFEPLGLVDTGYLVPEASRPRVAAMFGEANLDLTQEVPDGPQELIPADVSGAYPMDDPDYVFGGHGLFSTVADYSRIARFLSDGLAGDGARLISAHGISALWRNRIPVQQMPLAIGPEAMPGYGWGLAGRVMLDAGQAMGYTVDGEFGWAGAASTYFWVDPVNALTGVVMSQYLGPQLRLGDIMRDAVYQALEP